MSNFLLIFLYILFGLISGIFGGLGMGGGTLLIPLLTIFLNLNQKLSQGINLIAFVAMAFFSLFIHYKNGFLKLKGIFFIIFSGIIFSIIGALFTNVISSKNLRVAFGVFLCLLSSYQIVKLIVLSRKKKVAK